MGIKERVASSLEKRFITYSDSDNLHCNLVSGFQSWAQYSRRACKRQPRLRFNPKNSKTPHESGEKPSQAFSLQRLAAWGAEYLTENERTPETVGGTENVADSIAGDSFGLKLLDSVSFCTPLELRDGLKDHAFGHHVERGPDLLDGRSGLLQSSGESHLFRFNDRGALNHDWL